MEAEELKNNTVVVKYRSNYKCMREGVSFVFKHFSKLTSFLWPMVVACIVFDILLCYAQRSAAGYVLEGRAWPAQCYVILSSLLLAIAGVAFLAGIVWQQRKIVEDGHLPDVKLKKVWREVSRTFVRLLKIEVVFAVVFIVLFLVAGALMVQTLPHADANAGVSVGRYFVVFTVWLVAFCLLFLLFGCFFLIFYEYALGGKSLAEAFGSLRWSRRYLGRTVLLTFVLTLLTVVFVSLMSMPTFVCSYIDGVALTMRMNEEIAQLPSSYSYILLLSWLLAAVGHCLCVPFVYFPLCLNWGAIHSVENDRLGKESA